VAAPSYPACMPRLHNHMSDREAPDGVRQEIVHTRAPERYAVFSRMRVSMDFTPLRHRDYRLLFIAQSVSLLGTMVSYVALPFQMYRLTHSSLSVGLLGLAELLPLLVTAFIGGALADAMDKRRLVIVTDAMLAIGSLSLAAVAIHTPSPWMLYLLAAWMAAIAALQRPSMEALVPRLVAPDEVPSAATLAVFRGSLGMIAGPALGGALLASAGLPATYVVDAFSYLCSFICIWMVRSIRPPENPEPPSLAAVVEGFRYARSRQELIGTYVVDFVAMVFGMPLALFPAFSDLLGGPAALGLLYAAPAVGALLASVTGRWTPRVRRHGRAIMLAATIWGVAIVGFGISRSLWPALACLAVAGGADAISGMFRMTIWNQTIPDALRGRLASIEMVSYSSGPLLGNVEAGMVAAVFGVRASVISGGLLCVVGVLACGFLLPRFVAYRRD
jgi:MFS family permease